MPPPAAAGAASAIRWSGGEKRKQAEQARADGVEWWCGEPVDGRGAAPSVYIGAHAEVRNGCAARGMRGLVAGLCPAALLPSLARLCFFFKKTYTNTDMVEENIWTAVPAILHKDPYRKWKLH
jgi:hypothetical protein